MKKVFILCLLAIQVAHAQNAKTPDRNLKSLKKQLIFLDEYYYTHFYDLDIDSVANRTADLLVRILKSDSSFHTHYAALPNLTSVSSDDGKIRSYSFFFSSGGTAGEIPSTVVQWKNNDGSVETISLLKKGHSAFKEIPATEFYEIYKIKHPTKEIYLLRGAGSRISAFTVIESFLLLEIRNNTLLPYRGFPGNSSVLTLQCHEQVSARFDSVKQELTFEGIFVSTDAIYTPDNKFGVPTPGDSKSDSDQRWLKAKFHFDGRRFQETVSTSSDLYIQYCTYLKKGQIAKAIQLEQEDRPYYYSCLDADPYQPYLQAVHARAMEATRNCDDYTAAVYALMGIHSPEIRSCVDSSGDYSFNVRQGYSAYAIRLPMTDENTQILHDLAYLAGKGGFFTVAVPVLDVIIKNNPQRAVAYLNRGDLYYARAMHCPDETAAMAWLHRALTDYNQYAVLLERACEAEQIPARLYDAFSLSNLQRCSSTDNAEMYRFFLQEDRLPEAIALEFDSRQDSLCGDFVQTYLQAVHRKAQQVFARKDTLAAAAISRSALHSPLHYCSKETSDSSYLLYQLSGIYAANYVPSNSTTTQILNYLSYYTSHFGSYATLIEILDQIIVSHPNSAVAYLNRGDIHFAYIHLGNGDTDGSRESMEHALKDYSRYVSLMRKRKAAGIPARVYRRISDLQNSLASL